MMTTSRAVIFDMDGILIDSEPVSFESWRRAMAELGINYTFDDFLEIVGCNAVSTEKTICQQFNMPLEDYIRMRERRGIIMNEIFAADGVPIKPGVLDMFAAITGSNRALATSTSKNRAESKLRMSGLIEYLEHRVCGDQVIKGKPDPEIFLTAADKIAIQPENCIVLEDSAAGILAASRAGMETILIPDLQPVSETSERLANYQCESMVDAIEIVQEFLNK